MVVGYYSLYLLSIMSLEIFPSVSVPHYTVPSRMFEIIYFRQSRKISHGVQEKVTVWKRGNSNRTTKLTYCEKTQIILQYHNMTCNTTQFRYTDNKINFYICYVSLRGKRLATCYIYGKGASQKRALFQILFQPIW